MAAGEPGPGSRTERAQPSWPCLSAVSDVRPRDAETLSVALQQVTTCLGGLGAAVHRLDPGAHRLILVAADGPASADVQAWAELGEGEGEAPVVALRRGAYTWVSGDSLGVGAAGTVAIPLVGIDGPIGVLSGLVAGPGEPDEVRRSFLRTVAQWVGTGLIGPPGTPPGPSSVSAAARSVRMSELTVALAEAISTQDVARAVADYIQAPFGADGLVLEVLEAGRLHVVGSAGYPPEFLRVVEGIPLEANETVRDVVSTRTPRFIESRAEIYRRYPALRAVNELSPKEAWAFLPLIASGRVIGLCVVSFSRPRSFSEGARVWLMALSGMVGQALERARLYDMEHARAQELQRGLLPKTLPCLPAACAVARYLPAGRGEEVGGDWYDVIPLPADRVALVIGDVMGHGITEAATMGRLRTAVRTLADLDIPPDELFSRLNDLVSEVSEDTYATCLYAVFDPVAATFSYSLAGHPPPIVVRPDGTVHTADVAPDPPLGAAKPPFGLHRLHLSDGSMLVLCTDGLVESASRDVDQGMAQLRQILTEAATPAPHSTAGGERDDIRHLENLCDKVVSALLPDRGQMKDDAGLLIVRVRCTAPHDVISWNLPVDPRAAGQARDHIRTQLRDWDLDDLVLTTELLVSELVGNVVRHATGPVHLRLLRSRALTCEVYDGSLTTPRIRHPTHTDEGGRGLQLVAALSRRWGARYLQDGKCIWTEQDLPDRAGVA
ncbi:SpoIIE family protein phosphatase [Streptomyces sp. NPDC051985]|uniref:SpoIIE family protein phosphatase n=1 Tax=Streptomyces sp. NPDC051985 TaxID=3155807 RepID=UPI00343168EB